jgi:2-iminobutanoate/2-iminopropanoate deaminase
MLKKIIETKNAPLPIGPYNQATHYNDTLYVSGQIALNPETGELVIANIEDETHQVMQNIKAILEAAGGTFEDVLKCSVFVSDINMFGRINAVYGQYFHENTAPARELVQVANLPRFVNVEISVIAGIQRNTWY